jgi:hypothetical protein
MRYAINDTIMKNDFTPELVNAKKKARGVTL